MDEQRDLEALAHRYVELWQDHVAASATDPELTAALTRMMVAFSATFGASTSLWQGLWAAPKGPGSGDRQSAGKSTTSPAAAGATPSAAAPADGGHDVAKLLARIADLETRLAKLESDDPTPGGGSGPGPRGG